MNASVQHDYITQVEALLDPESKAKFIAHANAGRRYPQSLTARSPPRALRATRFGTRALNFEYLPLALDKESVVVIENINLDWIEILGPRWQIHPLFFAEHAAEFTRCKPVWNDVFGSLGSRGRWPGGQKDMWDYWTDPDAYKAESPDYQCSDSHWHIDGVLVCGKEPKDAINVDWAQNLFPRLFDLDSSGDRHEIHRVSCYRKRNGALLFLVDATRPRRVPSGHDRAVLRLPVSVDVDGLVVPELFDQDRFSMWDCFWKLVSNPWHFDVLFPEKDTLVPRKVVFFLLVAATWRHNLQVLNKRIKHISFKELRRPDIRINDNLHTHRQDLISLQSAIAHARSSIPETVRCRVEARDSKRFSHIEVYDGSLEATLDEIHSDSKVLERFLMDTFNLFLSSMSVLEAKASIEQAQRAQRLTQLACFYLPISFVTGVFGMNLNLINGATPKVWMVCCALTVTIACTVGALGLTATFPGILASPLSSFTGLVSLIATWLKAAPVALKERLEPIWYRILDRRDESEGAPF